MNKPIIWSKVATFELKKIKEFWDKKNKSNSYSSKILFHTELALNLIKNNPQIGVKSNIKNVRMRLVLKKFYLIYQIESSNIQVLRFWDVRQNPVKLNYTKSDQ